MRTKVTTIASIVAAGAVVWALATPAQAGTRDSGWQLGTAAAYTADDNNGNS